MSNLPKHAETLHIRLRTADREVITARATRAGLTVSEYIRRAALGTLQSTVAPTVSHAPPVVDHATGRANPAWTKYYSSADGDDPA